MDEHRAFIRAILSDPSDDTARLVYADWLDEREDPRGEFLRLEVREARGELTEHPNRDKPTRKARRRAKSRLRDLRRELDPKWLGMVERPGVENCGGEGIFKQPCAQKWDTLTPTDNDTVRFCDTCDHNVYFCGSIAEARGHSERGRCVAVSPSLARRPFDLIRRELMRGLIVMPRDRERE